MGIATSRLAPPLPFLAVVRFGDHATFTALQDHFVEQDHVRVIWDRRVAERRRRSEPTPVERRRGEHRREPPAPWNSLNYVLRPEEPAPSCVS